MKTAVVVGANGFLGSALVHELIKQNIEVIAIYNVNHDNINKKARLMKNQDLLASNFKIDFLFYLPGNYANSHSKLLGLNNILYQYSLKFDHAKIIYVSSTNVYGNPENVVTENSPFNQPQLYALSKLAGEFIVKSMRHFAILRLAYLYGSGITNNSFIPSIIKSAKKDKKITLFGDGEREQDCVYIDDAVSLCIACAKQDENEIYLGATGVSVSNKKVALEIQKHTGCIIEYKGIEKGQSFYFDPSQTFEKLNWQPKTSIEQGLKNMLT